MDVGRPRQPMLRRDSVKQERRADAAVIAKAVEIVYFHSKNKLLSGMIRDNTRNIGYERNHSALS